MSPNLVFLGNSHSMRLNSLVKYQLDHFSTRRTFLITSQRKARKSTKEKRGEHRRIQVKKREGTAAKGRFVTRWNAERQLFTT